MSRTQQLSRHLEELKENDVIEGLFDPKEKMDLISNIVVTQKSNGRK